VVDSRPWVHQAMFRRDDKAKWEKLPADVQKVFNDVSRRDREARRGWDQADQAGREFARSSSAISFNSRIRAATVESRRQAVLDDYVKRERKEFAGGCHAGGHPSRTDQGANGQMTSYSVSAVGGERRFPEIYHTALRKS